MGKSAATAAAAACVQSLRFVGSTDGAVKHLRGFRKGQHSVPDAVTPATTAFLARLCAEELAEEAEAVFQGARRLCGYKRADLTLTVASPAAVLTARDFTLEIAYALLAADPAAYRVSWTLSGATELAFLRGEASAELFAGRFQELIFGLTRGAPVEAVIDAVEGLEDAPLRVDYPSDCAHCRLRVPGVDAEVRFDGAELALVFPRGGPPGALLDGFLAVRAAFALTRSPVLSGLLG